MIRRLVRDEAGVAMGLAVIVVVIVGVMGAGLLVFVRNDLEAVVQVNQGQEAFEAADAGVQAARRELLSSACPQSYDGQEAGTSDEENPCADSEESEWSYEAVVNENVETTEAEANYVGRELDLDGKQIEVRIRYLPFPGEGACATGDTSDENCAPDNNPEGDDDEREFFKVESLGKSENGGARRKVEAIYNTYELGVPKAYYSPKSIDIKGSACIEGVSVFSQESISVSGGGNGCDGVESNIKGQDQVHGDWQNSYNNTARKDVSGNPVTNAGFAALGDVSVGESSKLGSRDFDAGTCPKFAEETDDTSTCGEPSTITFPFEHESQSGDSDRQRINFLRDEAMRQESETGEDHYMAPADSGNYSLSDWPANSDENTVVFVEFQNSGRTLKWDVSGDCDDSPPKQGTLVVRNGNFTTQPNKALFQGVVFVRGGESDDDTVDGESDDTGKTCIDGFVNASGSIKIAGNVQPFASEEVANRPGFYGVELWSWRELYE